MCRLNATTTTPTSTLSLHDALPILRARLDDDVAGIMLTNPNTLGLFEEDIVAIAGAVHEVGGLLYYDGANLNAILGVTRPRSEERRVGKECSSRGPVSH